MSRIRAIIFILVKNLVYLTIQLSIVAILLPKVGYFATLGSFATFTENCYLDVDSKLTGCGINLDNVIHWSAKI